MFYVYEHICIKTGQCFYVGKGKNNRAYSKHRSEKWHNFVKKYGEYIVNFLIKNVEEEFAFLIEKEVIDTYKKRGYKLTNLTDGGEGPSGKEAWNKGIFLSEEHKKHLSESRLKGITENNMSFNTEIECQICGKKFIRKVFASLFNYNLFNI